MNYQDVEYKLSQYAQWCGNPVKSLDYPGRSIYARAMPDAVNPDALPVMTDAEARVVGDALLALKAVNPPAHTAITARFMAHIGDDREIGRKYGLGSRATVHQLRLRGYSALQMFFYNHQNVKRINILHRSSI